MTTPTMLPICAVIPTMDRAAVLERTLLSLSAQSHQPAQIVIVDGSTGDATRTMLEALDLAHMGVRPDWRRAVARGAAAQRNEGVQTARHPFILFMDDDILFDDDCILRLWRAITADGRMGGVSAMIKNQRYHRPGRATRALLALFDGKASESYAGRVIGPAVNLLPEDRDDLPAVVPVDWVNTTCTLYRRDALPTPPFDPVFSGYSLMEDVTLSLRVAKTRHIANARTARIFHDSQLGAHKADAATLAEMSLVNRHYVMTEVLGHRRWRDYASLLLWEAFQMAAALKGESNKPPALDVLRGTIRGWVSLVRRTQDSAR